MEVRVSYKMYKFPFKILLSIIKFLENATTLSTLKNVLFSIHPNVIILVNHIKKYLPVLLSLFMNIL